MKLELKKIFIVFHLLCLTVTQASEPKTLELELEVLNPLEKPSDEGDVEVSNLEKIELKISLKKPEAKAEELPDLSQIRINPERNENLKHWVEVSAIFLSDGTEAKVLISSPNNELPAGQASIGLHFIQNPDTIEDNISRYLENLKDSVKDKYASNPTAENKMLLDFMKVHGDKTASFINTLKRSYFENRLGIYKIKITYCSRGPNGQQLRIEKSLPDLEVKDLGDCLCKIYGQQN